MAAIIQLGDALSHQVSIGNFAAFAGHFLPLWIAWSRFTFFFNRFDVDEFTHRIMVFIQMFAISSVCFFIAGFLLSVWAYGLWALGALAILAVTVLKEEISAEGHHLRRLHDMKLMRDRTPLFAMSWFIVHEIEDGTYGQTTYSRHVYYPDAVRGDERIVVQGRTSCQWQASRNRRMRW